MHAKQCSCFFPLSAFEKDAYLGRAILIAYEFKGGIRFDQLKIKLLNVKTNQTHLCDWSYFCQPIFSLWRPAFGLRLDWRIKIERGNTVETGWCGLKLFQSLSVLKSDTRRLKECYTYQLWRDYVIHLVMGFPRHAVSTWDQGVLGFWVSMWSVPGLSENLEPSSPHPTWGFLCSLRLYCWLFGCDLGVFVPTHNACIFQPCRLEPYLCGCA